MIDTMRRLAEHGVHVLGMELGRYLVAAGAVTLLLWIGRSWTLPRRIQVRMADWSDRRREFVNSLVTVAIFGLIGIYLLLMIENGFYRVSEATPPLWLGLVEFAGILIAHDAWFYWMHRGLHSRAMFRRAHLEHHLSRTPTPWAAYSFAPMEALFEGAFVPILLIVFPMHAGILIAFVLHQIIRNVLGHMGHELAWPGFTRSWLTGWLTTTTHHDLHHSHGNSNYGLYFTWWDRWMGTEHPRYHEAFETAALPWFAGKGSARAAAE